MKFDRIIEVRSELGAGSRGASLGVDAIRMAAFSAGSQFFFKRPSIVIPDENHLLMEPVVTEHARWIRGVYEVNARTCAKVAKELNGNTTPLVLTGDHGNAAGVMAGIKKAFPGKELGIVWIDAHADLHTPYTSPSGNMHGMPLAAALGMDNKAQQVNEPLPETVELWEKLKNLGGLQRNVKPENLAFLGLRDFEKQEQYLLEKYDIQHFSTEQLRQTGIEEACRQVIESLTNCDHIYVSFDVDSLDPSISRGTGTPVEGGLTPEEVVDLINHLAINQDICALEITEVNPLLDEHNKMAEAVIRILDKIVQG